MKLNRDGRNELRAKIQTYLSSVPEGKRIHLDKELLDELLFEDYVCNEETGVTVKLPLWSGDFLRKIDLSEISFENVGWSFLYPNVSEKFWDLDPNFDAGALDRFLNTIENYELTDKKYVDYSFSNARIDFSKSWEAKNMPDNEAEVFFCDFSGVDLSVYDIPKFICFYKCNLSNTNMVLTSEMLGEIIPGNDVIFYDTNLSGVDLSDISVNGLALVAADEYLFNSGCNLSNTGLNIDIDPADFEDEKEGSNDNSNTIAIEKMIEKGFLEGCFINGNRIEYIKENDMDSDGLLSEYDEFKKAYIDSVINDIDNQISGFRK